MKMIISPAKSLNFDKEVPSLLATQPLFTLEAERINKLLKKKSVKSLAKLMSISQNLAQLNWERNQNFELPFTSDNARPAVYTFDGDVYLGLDIYTLPLDKLDALQKQLRILSGLYGLLKPLDLIQAYRLEMGTKFPVGVKKNLPTFWKPKIAKVLNEEMQEGELLINLASNEYFAAIDTKTVKAEIITPQFKDFNKGEFKVISFLAKKARGMMARYIIDNDCRGYKDILDFDTAGYKYSEEQTKNASHPVFIR